MPHLKNYNTCKKCLYGNCRGKCSPCRCNVADVDGTCKCLKIKYDEKCSYYKRDSLTARITEFFKPLFK